MSMLTRVIGFRPPDDTWRKHKAVWDSCMAVGVEVPAETRKFFDHDPPDDAGVEVEIQAEPWESDAASGFHVAIADLPKGVTHLRFYNSW